MFPTFTGSSRRPRNVNLSGQPKSNAWGSSSWTQAGSGSGASKTVAQAQAERERRQREREELAAAKQLQRAWRGHVIRTQIKQIRRQEYDHLYEQPALHGPSGRVAASLPLLLTVFDPKQPDDQHRLDLLVQDLSAVGPPLGYLESSGQYLWDRLARLLVRALERRPTSSSQELLGLMIDIVKNRPGSVRPLLHQYYRLLARYFEEGGQLSLPADQRHLLAEAATAPLAPTATNRSPEYTAYRAFSSTFLASPNLLALQQDPALIAQSLDLQVLSESVVDNLSAQEQVGDLSKDGLLWLLAHFIALNRAMPTSQGSSYLKALYLQLSILATDIRIRTREPEQSYNDASSDDEDNVQVKTITALPRYVVDQLDFLVNEDGITELLSRFTSTASSSARLSEDASLLAGYTLVLLRCFPSHVDDIKMRLFQGDISVSGSKGFLALPTVKYFWNAASKTEIFSRIVQNKGQQRHATVVSLLKSDPSRDQEWRTILLFLEMYNFLLRVTDDEDFLPSEVQMVSRQSPATVRIRSSGLDIDELKQLVNFLKTLSLPLYYNLSDIMPARSQSRSLNAIMGVSSSQPQEEQVAAPSFAGIWGMDVLGLRNASTTTLRSLYERDSRRPFLPANFWLMTQTFEMDGFINAVVLEETRADEMDESGDEDDVFGGPSAHDSFHTFSGHRLSRAAQIERQRQLRKVQREQALAQYAPKLEVLRNMPFVIPFDFRVKIFRQFVLLDKSKRRNGYVDPDQWRLWLVHNEGHFNSPAARARDVLGRHMARVKRGHVFEDAFDQFYPLGEGLKEPIQITFVDLFDQPEAGIDGGGVTKEFLTSITNEALDPGPDGPGLFVANSQNLLFPNPSAFENEAAKLRSEGYAEGGVDWRIKMAELAKHYEFLGRVVGKCMYEGILLDKTFASFFLLKWASSGMSAPGDYRANLNDLRELDPELYQGLLSLKNYPGDVSDLALDFTITDEYTLPSGEVKTVDRPLRKDGMEMPVTNKNRPLYISYVVNHRLVAQPYRQTKAFLRGLGSIINPSWLSMFNQSELQRLVGGDSTNIDVEDWRSHTGYSGLYVIGDDGEEHPTVRMFWEVLREMEDRERRLLLKYVTSTPRAPLLGFEQLSPQFTIRDGGTDEERLPSTSTCINLLKLPKYNSKKTLREKLLYAINAEAGFDLS
ncbi:hypothetical protein F4778DRAFT_758173 [Xylariomycetidae sp. FL2044]|nr:hypothetical protein F4778DRAFT_758173 [Xylariomycetidae sp. FL2044]